MRFDLTDLRLFLNVHLTGTITAAADSSHMSLAAASERIRGMESQLGAPLLLRDRRGVQLTPAGRTVVHHARLVLAQFDRLQGELAHFGAGTKGHVRLLCNTSALTEHLPLALGQFLNERPGISVDLEERTSLDIVDALRNDGGDIGVVSDAADLDGLEVFPFRPDPLICIVPRGHPLAACARVDFGSVLGHALVGLTEGSALQDYLAQQARRLGQRLNHRVRLRSFESVCRLVGLGVGVGIVPKAVASRCARSAGIKVIPLSDAWASRSLVVCVKRMEALPEHVRQLVRHLLAGPAGAAPPA